MHIEKIVTKIKTINRLGLSMHNASLLLNPLVPEFCYQLIFESGSYRLPTHKRDAYLKFTGNFFNDTFFFF